MEESAPLITSIQTSMNTWFTPTVLFIFLNLMIATILFTSNLPTNHNKKQQSPDQKPSNQNDSIQSKLAGSPSILHRLKSFSFHPHRSQYEPSPVTSNHEQQQQHQQQEQEALEIAATQYVFSHPFTHEQDPQPVDLQGHSVNYNNNFAPSLATDQHEQQQQEEQGGLEIAATQDVFNHRFTNEQDLQPVGLQGHSVTYNNNNFNFNTTSFFSEANFKQTNEVGFDNAKTHFEFNPTQSEKEDRPEEDAGFVETHEEEDDDFESLDEVYSKITGGNVNRTKSDTSPASGEVPVRLPAKMKKSASLKSAFSHFEVDKIVEARRPATVKERRSPAVDDVEVDSKADDFINKFKHQLKLQRLDSIIRYKDMVNRGGGK